MKVRVSFLGAAESVTGSKYLLKINDFTLLIDCGLFQGLKELRLRNWAELPLEETKIDAVVLTHAHLDHSGYLPRLVKNGFSGPIHCTRGTADLLSLLLLDSAKLQEEEAEFARKKGYSKHENPQPLYDTNDVKRVLPLVHSHAFHTRVQIAENIHVVFYYAGHILGASMVEVILQGETQQKTLLFSGDLGRQNDPILYPPDRLEKADILFVESTYGDRKNSSDHVKEDLAELINAALARKGCILIPAFAVGRTQNMLMILKDLMAEKRIPEIEIFMDSPMAIAATEIYARHQEEHRLTPEAIEKDPSFAVLNKNLITVTTREASIYLNGKKEGAIIISASGMLSGGRILHHLYNRLPHKNDTFLIVGYQAEGTRGRKLIDGARSVRIFGETVPVYCHLENVRGLSAHADQTELFDWLAHFTSKPKHTFVIHGEQRSAETMKEKIQKDLGWNVSVPKYLENVELFDGI